MWKDIGAKNLNLTLDSGFLSLSKGKVEGVQPSAITVLDKFSSFMEIEIEKYNIRLANFSVSFLRFGGRG